MKIKQNKEFKPVTITLETIEEVYTMWHRMNLSSNTVEEYTECNKVPFIKDSDLDYTIFKFLSKVIDNYKDN